MQLRLYHVSQQYCDFLRKTDLRVPIVVGDKRRRPFVGIVLRVNDITYYAPLSSPKPKHVVMKNQVDFIKIENGKYGAINLNNMIPVPPQCLKKIDLSIKESDSLQMKQYKHLLQNQSNWCTKYRNQIIASAEKLHRLVTKATGATQLKKRCCDFARLEKAYHSFTQMEADDDFAFESEM